jgi:hypothetical protein
MAGIDKEEELHEGIAGKKAPDYDGCLVEGSGSQVDLVVREPGEVRLHETGPEMLGNPGPESPGSPCTGNFHPSTTIS